jgi:diamine N-acetyltransferase
MGMDETVGPNATVTLREITIETVIPICKLSDTLTEPQSHMVAPNALSIAEAHFSEYAWFRAIYADETPVGFIMLYDGPGHFDPGVNVHFLWRLMVARPYQGMGFGRRAVELLIEKVRAEGASELLTSCGEGEGSPEGFYRKLGFVRDGKMYDHEIGLGLDLQDWGAPSEQSR